MVDDIARAVDSGELWVVVLLDLSVAFDTVDHRILLEVRHKRFAVEGEALQWFESYLTSRTVTVRVLAQTFRARPVSTVVSLKDLWQERLSHRLL